MAQEMLEIETDEQELTEISKDMDTIKKRTPPQKRLRNKDAWIWTREEWEQKEREADEDIAKGAIIGPFDNIDDALLALKTTKV